MKFDHKISIVSLFLLSTLFGCTNASKSSSTFRLSAEFYTSENKGLEYVDYQSSLAVKKIEKASFAFLVYLSGCLSCTLFTPIVEEYVSENNLRFYAIDIKEIKSDDDPLYQTIKYAPSFVIYKDGQFFTFLDSGNIDHVDYFDSLVGFKTWFETYIDITPSSGR